MKHSTYSIKEFKDKTSWEKYNTSFKYPAFFQSWFWGDLQIHSGITILRYGIYSRGTLIGIMQVAEITARRGHFLQIRHGPVVKEWNDKLIAYLVKFLTQLAHMRNASFIRISPLVEASYVEIFQRFGFRMSAIHNIDAENRWTLDLSSPIEKILSQMRKTTRYIIRKGDNSIKIIRSTKPSDIDEFLDVYQKTAVLKKFVPHSEIRSEFNEFLSDNASFVYYAYRGKVLLAAALIVYYGDEAIYRHGATSIEGRKTNASYLLQWNAINDAKKRGLKIYDFWGIAKDENPKNPWFGLTQFKKGFGGRQIDFMHSLDLPLGSNYWISYLIDFATKVRKGFLRN